MNTNNIVAAITGVPRSIANILAGLSKTASFIDLVVLIPCNNFKLYST